MIDPALQQILAAMAAAGFAMPEPMSAPAMRAAFDIPFPGPPIEIAEVRDVASAGAAGPIAARLYHPAPGQVLPLAVFMHGGGWVMGTLETHDRLSRVLARDSGCAILSLDYRLAPEHPFPAALDDCLAAIAELPARAAEFGIRADRYGVVGDSAGGNLAAAVALASRDTARPPAVQVLLYPVLDADDRTASYRDATNDALLTPAMMRFFWNAYLGDAPPSAHAAPLRAEDLTGVAPAVMILAGNDPLHDEGVAYAVRLRDAGVAVDLHDFDGAIHGFASFFGLAPIGDEAVGLAAAALARLRG